MIEFLEKIGFKTLRTPTTWHNYFIDENHKIDPEWIKRLKTIVDWGIKYGLYIIINIHHDIFKKYPVVFSYGKGCYPSYRYIKESEKFIYNLFGNKLLQFLIMDI